MMKVPHLGESPFFRIPPRVTLSELEDKLKETDLASNDLVRKALSLAQSMHANQPRYSGQPTLEEHIYPIAFSILDYQAFQRRRGNLTFLNTSPNGVVVALTHENFEEEDGLEIGDFKRTFGDEIYEMVWLLNQPKYLREGAKDYAQYTKMKFKALETAPWPAQVAGLADKLNNTLCLYTEPYI